MFWLWLGNIVMICAYLNICTFCSSSIFVMQSSRVSRSLGFQIFGSRGLFVQLLQKTLIKRKIVAACQISGYRLSGVTKTAGRLFTDGWEVKIGNSYEYGETGHNTHMNATFRTTLFHVTPCTKYLLHWYNVAEPSQTQELGGGKKKKQCREKMQK